MGLAKRSSGSKNILTIFIDSINALLTAIMILSRRSQREQSEWKGQSLTVIHKKENAIFENWMSKSLDKKSDMHIMTVRQ